MSVEIRENTLTELRNTSKSASSLLRNKILVTSALIAGFSLIADSESFSFTNTSQYLFSGGIGSLFGSILLSMQSQIYRWNENATIIPLELYRESEEKAKELTTSQLQKSVRKARGTLYPAYLMFFFGLGAIAVSFAQLPFIKDFSRIIFLIPLILCLVTLLRVERRNFWKYPF